MGDPPFALNNFYVFVLHNLIYLYICIVFRNSRWKITQVLSLEPENYSYIYILVALRVDLVPLGNCCAVGNGNVNGKRHRCNQQLSKHN